MKITDTSSIVQAATQNVKEPQTARAAETKQTKPDAKPQAQTESVSLSSNKGEVVERQEAPPANAKPEGKQADIQTIPDFSKDISRDYSVEETGQLVVKIIDNDSDEVVREIPPEEQRRIKEAIAELNKNSVVSELPTKQEAPAQQSQAQASGAPPVTEIDVTT